MYFASLRLMANPNAILTSVEQYDRLWRNRKKDCERDTCGHLIPDEAANCVNVCISQSCFNEVYGPEAGGGLEDGEIDTERERTFTTCLRKVR